MRSFLEIARNALRDVQHPDGTRLDEAYRERLREAMRQIEHVCPAGALRWARKTHPDLTDRIDVEIFTRLNDLWSEHVPLPEFQAVLDELLRLHSEVGKLNASE